MKIELGKKIYKTKDVLTVQACIGCVFNNHLKKCPTYLDKCLLPFNKIYIHDIPALIFDL